MAAAALQLAPIALGAIGLMQQSDAQSSARKANAKAVKSAEDQAAPGLAAQNALLALANAYDPAASDQTAINQASTQTADTLQKALSNLSSSYGLSGGVPGNSSAFAVNSQKVTNQTLGPFAQYVANLKSTETQRKAAMYSTVQAPTGQLSNAYFKQADSYDTTSPTASLSLLSQGLSKILNPGTKGSKIPPNTDLTSGTNAVSNYQQTGNLLGQNLPNLSLFNQ